MELQRRMWSALAIRGLAAILFGLAVIFWPGISIKILVYLFAVYAVLDGIFALVAGIRSRLWALLLEGLIGLAAGISAAIWPQIAIIILIYIIAVWALATGMVEILAAINLRKILKREWLLLVGGIGSIALGILLFVFPNVGVAALIWIIGIYAVLFGSLLLGVTFVLLSSPQPQQAG